MTFEFVVHRPCGLTIAAMRCFVTSMVRLLSLVGCRKHVCEDHAKGAIPAKLAELVPPLPEGAACSGSSTSRLEESETSVALFHRRSVVVVAAEYLDAFEAAGWTSAPCAKRALARSFCFTKEDRLVHVGLRKTEWPLVASFFEQDYTVAEVDSSPGPSEVLAPMTQRP